jgi:hypothetical protein
MYEIYVPECSYFSSYIEFIWYGDRFYKLAVMHPPGLWRSGGLKETGEATCYYTIDFVERSRSCVVTFPRIAVCRVPGVGE